VNVSKEERRLLSLTKRETELLRGLETLKKASMQDLSDTLKVSRTSLYWPLTQLQKRNLVAYEMLGKRKRWYSRMGELPLRKKLGSLESVAGDVRVVEGVEQLRELYSIAIDLHATERLIILEGNLSAQSIREQGGIEFMTTWHARANKKKVIIESIFGEKVHTELVQSSIDSNIVKSLSHLSTWIAHIVPDEWINVDATLLLFRDTAILADWTRAHAVLVNTPEIVALLRNSCKVFQLTGRKVNIVAEVRNAAAKLISAPTGKDAGGEEAAGV